MTSPSTVDAYIAAQPPEHRAALEAARAAIRTALPDARETIAYGMPAYRLEGRHAVYFAGWKRHYAAYPLNDAIRTNLADELATYEVEKDTVRFSWTAPVPAAFIARLAKAIAGL